MESCGFRCRCGGEVRGQDDFVVVLRAERPAPTSSAARERPWVAVVAFDGGLGNRLFQAAFAMGCARPRGGGGSGHAAAFAFHKVQEITHHSTRTYVAELFERFPADRSIVVQDDDEDVDLYYTEDPESSKRHDPRAQDPPECIERAFALSPSAEEGLERVPAIRVLYRGRFVNPAYFEHCRDELRAILRPEPPCVRARLGAAAFPWERSAFVHVRLGDYVGDDRYWDPASLAEFYDASLRDLEKRASRLQGAFVLVFTDGTSDQVRRHYPMLHARIAACGFVSVDVRDGDELAALYAMARCGLGGIVPNSTFSWWAAFIGGRPCYHYPSASSRVV